VLIETSTMSQIVTREQQEWVSQEPPIGVPAGQIPRMARSCEAVMPVEAAFAKGQAMEGRSGPRTTEIARIAAAGLGEAAITDDCGLSRKVRAGMPVLESHARNRPHTVDFSNEAAIRDDRT
jgi:hypothetical protein